MAAPCRWAQRPPPSPGFDGTERDEGDGDAALTHAGVPVPVEVVAGPAGAAVTADAVLAAVLARGGQALVRIWVEWGAETEGRQPWLTPLTPPAMSPRPPAPWQLWRSAESCMPGPHSQTKPPSVLTQRPSQAALRHSSMSGGGRREGRDGDGGPPPPPPPPPRASHRHLPVPPHRCSGCRWPSPAWRSRGGKRGPLLGSRRGYRRGRSRTPRTSPAALKHGQGERRAPMPPQRPPLPQEHPYPRQGRGPRRGER